MAATAHHPSAAYHNPRFHPKILGMCDLSHTTRGGPVNKNIRMLAWMGVRTVKSTELFTGRDGRRSDAPLHDPILASGEKAKAFAMTVASLRAQDWSDEEIREAFPGHAVPPIST